MPLVCLQDAAEIVVSSLGLEVRIEQQGRGLLPPAVLVADTPDGDTDTVLEVNASIHCGLVVRGRGSGDVELGDSAFADDGAEVLQRGGVLGDGPAATQVRLRANAVDRNASSDPLGDLRDHTLGLSVVGGVEVVVVDVQLGVRVGLASSLEGSGDETLTQHIVEHGGTEATILGKDLVDDVLSKNQ